MKYRTNTQGGFTAVELLITLLVASMFLFAGYQLYVQVVRDSAAANKIAVLSNNVSQRLRDAALAAPPICVASSPAPVVVNEPGIGNVSYSTVTSCPNAAGLPTLKRITVEATYDTNKKVSHAAYDN